MAECSENVWIQLRVIIVKFLSRTSKAPPNFQHGDFHGGSKYLQTPAVSDIFNKCIAFFIILFCFSFVVLNFWFYEVYMLFWRVSPRAPYDSIKRSYFTVICDVLTLSMNLERIVKIAFSEWTWLVFKNLTVYIRYTVPYTIAMRYRKLYEKHDTCRFSGDFYLVHESIHCSQSYFRPQSLISFSSRLVGFYSIVIIV